jgi:hypothetical protein
MEKWFDAFWPELLRQGSASAFASSHTTQLISRLVYMCTCKALTGRGGGGGGGSCFIYPVRSHPFRIPFVRKNAKLCVQALPPGAGNRMLLIQYL